MKTCLALLHILSRYTCLIMFVLKLELLAAKNLIGANLDGTSDSYAIISCGGQTRYRCLLVCLHITSFKLPAVFSSKARTTRYVPVRQLTGMQTDRYRTVAIPFGDIYVVLQIKRSLHACINPAITIVLQMGSGGHGVPPLKGPDGRTFVSRCRVRYKFASFWNRNHSIRALWHTIKLYRARLDVEKV
ncbi:hypothetical protein GW17_00018162 [Ensete ventricosum]|nr:hypothetical protein GW17_00018162 [Ensete ventricosum]